MGVIVPVSESIANAVIPPVLLAPFHVATSLTAYRWLLSASIVTQDGFSSSKTWTGVSSPLLQFISKT